MVWFQRQRGISGGGVSDSKVYEFEVSRPVLSNLAKKGLWAGRIGYRGWLVRRTVRETWNDSGQNVRNIAMMKGQSQSGNAYEQLSILT